MTKKIRVKTFDWKEDVEAKTWIGHHQAAGWKVYSYDTQSDTWLLIAIKGGVITKKDLDVNLPPGYQSLYALRLVKPVSFPKAIHKMDFDTARTYIKSKDEEFGGVF